MSDQDPRPRDQSAPERDQRAEEPRRPDHQTWRTEGLPPSRDGGGDKPRRPRWVKWVSWIVGGYIVLFLLTTV